MLTFIFSKMPSALSATEACTMPLEKVGAYENWDEERGWGIVEVGIRPCLQSGSQTCGCVVDTAVAQERKAALVAIGADGVHARQTLREMG